MDPNALLEFASRGHGLLDIQEAHLLHHGLAVAKAAASLLSSNAATRCRTVGRTSGFVCTQMAKALVRLRMKCATTGTPMSFKLRRSPSAKHCHRAFVIRCSARSAALQIYGYDGEGCALYCATVDTCVFNNIRRAAILCGNKMSAPNFRP